MTQMTPTHQGDDSLRGTTSEQNDIVNGFNNFKLLSFNMGTAQYHDIDDIDEMEGFYQLQKLKRISTANLKRLYKSKAPSDTDNLLCAPAEDTFVTSLDVLEEVSEPDASCYSLSEGRAPIISGSCRTVSQSSRTSTPIQKATKVESGFSVNRRVAESQDRINLLLEELEVESRAHYRFVTGIIVKLRPFFRSLGHIVSHFPPPDDKWSAFIHYVTFLATEALDDEAPDAMEAFDRAHAGAMTQLSYALDLWLPQPPGPRRWTLRMQQACNIWQDSLHDLQFCRLKDIDSSLLNSKDQDEVRKVMGMENLAEAMCNYALRFGQQWDGNWQKLFGGRASVGSTGGRGRAPRERTSLPEEPSRGTYGTLSSSVAPGRTAKHMDDSQAANTGDVQRSPTERKFTEESLRILRRKYNSVPHLHRDPHWGLDLSNPVPKLTVVSDMSSTTSGKALDKTHSSQKSIEQAVQKDLSSARMPASNLTISPISQVDIKPSEMPAPGKFPKESQPEATFAPQQRAESPQNTSKTVSDASHTPDGSRPSAPRAESWRQAAPSPLLVQGNRLPSPGLPSPGSGQSWQRTSSITSSSKTADKAKNAWGFVKKAIKEHHEAANATVATHYTQGQDVSKPQSHVAVETSAVEMPSYTDNLPRDSNTITIRSEFTLESVRALPIRTQSVRTTFSDLESYRSTSLESLATIKSYGPVPLPPRTAAMKNYTADLESEISSLAESSHTIQNDNRLSWLTSTEKGSRESEPICSPIEHERFVQAPGIAPVVNTRGNHWSPPSEWSILPSAAPEALSPPVSPRLTSRLAPFRFFHSASKKTPSEKVNDHKDESKSKDTPWHSNRTKGAQAQRLHAQRKEARKARKNKEDYERYKELEQRLAANGFLAPLGESGNRNDKQ